MEPLDAIRAKMWNISITYPVAIFGHDQKSLIPIQTVVIDILETVAGMLLELDVVGTEGNANYVHQYTREYNSDGERVYGNVTGCQWFKNTEKAINADTGRKAIANAKLIIRIINTPDLSDPLDIISERTIYVAYLKAICDIQCDQEIIYPYGRKYNHYS